MSVAFTREEDLEAAAAFVPDRPVSSHANLVTLAGLKQLDDALEAARHAYAVAQADSNIKGDKIAIATAARDLRYYAARRASAEPIESDPAPGLVQFGRTVTFERDDGRRQRFKIVGEDEADPKAGSVSHVSPLARALLGRRIGDLATVGESEVEVLAVE